MGGGLDEMNREGLFFDPLSAVSEVERLKQVLMTRGREMFFKLAEKIDYTEFDVAIDVTSESVDKAVLSQNLISILQTAASVPQAGIDPVAIVKQIFDLSGLDPRQVKAQTPNPMTVGQNPVMMPSMGAPGAAPTEQSITTAANVIR